MRNLPKIVLLLATSAVFFGCSSTTTKELTVAYGTAILPTASFPLYDDIYGGREEFDLIPLGAADSAYSEFLDAESDYLYLGKTEEQKIPMLYLLEKAAKLGSVPAQLKMGLIFDRGTVVKQDLEKAAYWYDFAAKAGNSTAISNLAWLHLNGYGVEKDEDKAIAFYSLLSDKGFKSETKKLALLSLEGMGTEKNIAKAIELLTELAEDNDVDAQLRLASFYLESEPKSVTKSLFWLAKAAKQDHPTAYLRLGNIFAMGDGVPKDGKKAEMLYTRAMELGSVVAMNNLGILYSNGVGVKKDPPKAFELYLEAARLGNALAQNSLAIAFLNGEGVEPNVEVAYALFDLSRAGGNKKAEKAIIATKKMMSEGQIAKAEALSFEAMSTPNPMNRIDLEIKKGAGRKFSQSDF